MGGTNADGAKLSSVSIFNPAGGTYAKLPPMNYPRQSASSCIYNNDVIITGGSSDGIHGQATIENMRINQHPPRWTISEGLHFKLYSHVQIVYQEKLLVIGGYRSETNEISDEMHELSLPSPYTPTLLARMPQPRSMHRAEIVNGNLFILGGTTTSDPVDGLDSVIRYDPISNGFKICPPLPKPVCDMSTVTWGDKIIVLGGLDKNGRHLNDVIMYDTESGRSERLPSLKNKRSGHSAVIIADVIFVFGGMNKRFLNLVESFMMGSSQQSWTEQPIMPEKRYGVTAVVKPLNGTVCSN